MIYGKGKDKVQFSIGRGLQCWKCARSIKRLNLTGRTQNCGRSIFWRRGGFTVVKMREKLDPEMRVLYLHGFASSPASRKAMFFLKKLAEHGIPADALNLAPDFRTLTISGQLAVIEEAAHGDQIVLIGSSMGGYLAALYAARHSAVARLVLLAPAFDFYQLWAKEFGPEKLTQWRENGTIPVYHYGLGREAELGYRLMEDAREYEPFPDVSQPCLILHGRNDSVVPFEKSAQFAANRPNVKLIGFNSGHELTDVLTVIWEAASTFLLGVNTKGA